MKKKIDIQRYNQILWAVIGTAVVAAAAIAVLIVAVTALYFTFKSDGGVPVAVVEENEKDDVVRKSVNYDFCQPIAVYGSPYQLIRVTTDRLIVRNRPVATKRAYVGSSSEASYQNGCTVYGKNGPSAITNVFARHADSGAMRLLLKENAVIHTLEYPQPPVGQAESDIAQTFPPPGMLYWEIGFDDSNGDNVIDERDDAGAYLSSIDGHNFVRITPTMSRVLEKTYDKRRKRLFLRIARDTNGDKRLDDEDAPSLIEVSVAERKIVREILNRESLPELMRRAEPKRPLKQ